MFTKHVQLFWSVYLVGFVFGCWLGIEEPLAVSQSALIVLHVVPFVLIGTQVLCTVSKPQFPSWSSRLPNLLSVVVLLPSAVIVGILVVYWAQQLIF